MRVRAVIPLIASTLLLYASFSSSYLFGMGTCKRASLMLVLFPLSVRSGDDFAFSDFGSLAPPYCFASFLPPFFNFPLPQ